MPDLIPVFDLTPYFLDTISTDDLVKALEQRCEQLLVLYVPPQNVTEDETCWYKVRDKGDSFTLLGMTVHCQQRYLAHLKDGEVKG